MVQLFTRRPILVVPAWDKGVLIKVHDYSCHPQPPHTQPRTQMVKLAKKMWLHHQKRLVLPARHIMPRPKPRPWPKPCTHTSNSSPSGPAAGSLALPTIAGCTVLLDLAPAPAAAGAPLLREARAKAEAAGIITLGRARRGLQHRGVAYSHVQYKHRMRLPGSLSWGGSSAQVLYNLWCGAY